VTAEEQIEKFWFALEHSWDIEPRSYFEAEAPKNGFGSPLAMAVHYMWKRDAKVVRTAFERRGLHCGKCDAVMLPVTSGPYVVGVKCKTCA
jgi:hypothetical protein